MMDKEKTKPARLVGPPHPWISKMINGSYDHYTCLLPENIGRLASLLLKLFYSGIKLDHEQTEKIRQLEKNAVVVYVTKFKSNFDYLFYYSRYRQEQLPLPQIGFDYNVY
ncbi:MAG: hypothetical protein ACR2PH_10920, partial [Desulfobulbia bacterium]